MRKNLLLGLVLLASLVYPKAYADSPLTSTDISSAYSGFIPVIEASQANGWLTESLMEYLADDDYRLDVRIAVINELGWDIDGKHNFVLMLTYLMDSGYFLDEEDVFINGSAELLTILAYLLALDNYFDVELAQDIAGLALNKDPYSFTVNIVFGLIAAQQAVIDQDFCLAWVLTNAVRQDDTLVFDMELDAYYSIYEYMDLYAESCE
jgi:hypothetical protein